MADEGSQYRDEDEREGPPLTPEVLHWAYCRGIFPMADPEAGEEVVHWYSPDPRGIIPLEAFHVPRTLAREVRRGAFSIESDRDFPAVMRRCAAPRSEDNGAWINAQFIDAYCRLHHLGFAHSVEARLDDQLVGGLYGVHIGAAFFGESMFVCPEAGGANASKVCLVHLVGHLQRHGFHLLDTQFWNPHLDQFGCVEIPREDYLQQLARAVAEPVTWEPFELGVT